MRLIDADEFKEIIVTYGKAGFAAIRINKICELIDSQTTAYDVDKAVERIECEYLMCRCKNDEMCKYPETIGCCYDNGIKKAVEIVKSGGIE